MFWKSIVLQCSCTILTLIWSAPRGYIIVLWLTEISLFISAYVLGHWRFRAPTPPRSNLKTKVSLWKRIKCFPSTLRRRYFWICVWRKLGHGNHLIIVTSLFSKNSVFKMFSVHTIIKKPAFLNSSGLKCVFEKPRFRDGLMWTVGLTVEVKLRFQMSPA